jgi:leucyl aminopeptidase (aminopeptidase T)
LEEIARDTTILISMPQFSATAPLLVLTRKHANLRVASMPLVSRAMEETGLSADYNQVARTCAQLASLFDQSEGIEVLFSTGQRCYFDKSDHKPATQDNGRLQPGETAFRLRNLPSEEVFVVPNERPESKTSGEIPVSYGSETAIFVVQGNRIIDVQGDGPVATQKRQEFRAEQALSNIAEVAIGCNDKAVVTGNVLEDEKAGFHWAYGRSEFLGGTVSPKEFSAPDKVLHQDVVYAKGNPIVCERFDFIFPDGSRKTAIVNGVLNIEG